MTNVIYENPNAPLPSEAKYLACDQHNTFWFSYKPRIVAQENPARPRWSQHDGEVNTKDYLIDGAWWETTRRLIRLSDPDYYVPENPHTDDEGRLPHDGGPMPEHLRGKYVEVQFSDGHTYGPVQAQEWAWAYDPGSASDPRFTHLITAYRVVEDQGRQVPPHRSGGGYPPQEPPSASSPFGNLRETFDKFLIEAHRHFPALLNSADELERLREGLQRMLKAYYAGGPVDASYFVFQIQGLLNDGGGHGDE